MHRHRFEMWHLIGWSLVMGALSWLLVRMWSESLYDRHRPRTRRSWLQRGGKPPA